MGNGPRQILLSQHRHALGGVLVDGYRHLRMVHEIALRSNPVE